jgi:hypothetical protein
MTRVDDVVIVVHRRPKKDMEDDRHQVNCISSNYRSIVVVRIVSKLCSSLFLNISSSGTGWTVSKITN